MRRVILLVALVALVTVAFTGCGGGSDNKIDTHGIEQQIRKDLPAQLVDQLGDGVSVDSIDCIANDQAMTAKCIAKLSNAANGDPAGLYRVGISVDVDRNTGEAIWTVDQ